MPKGKPRKGYRMQGGGRKKGTGSGRKRRLVVTGSSPAARRATQAQAAHRQAELQRMINTLTEAQIEEVVKFLSAEQKETENGEE